MFMLHPKFSKPGMIANVQSKIQIVDTHGLLETLISIDVAAGTSQFNRTLVRNLLQAQAIQRQGNHKNRTRKRLILKKAVAHQPHEMILAGISPLGENSQKTRTNSNACRC
jgi:hypothetical protein